jgi:AcrR family transcriptional regulator
MTAAKRSAPQRDPAKTRARILKAATAEFAAKGYSGARTEQIALRARSNIRMLYHYFGSKEALYVQVLEEVLGDLRQKELQLDFDAASPMDGILQMFDFIDDHFGARPELRSLLAFENLNRAQHMKRSERIRSMASPVIALIGRLLDRGAAGGTFRAGIDPLHLYVAMVSLAYYSKAHAPTLSRIFETDLAAPEWQRAQRLQTEQMLAGYLAPAPAPSPPTRKKNQ